MSDNIPFELQTEIIQRIPDTKSLIQFRSVWKSVIDSKDFVTAHTQDCGNNQVKYYSIVDDDTFPHQKISVFVPDSVNKFRLELLGTSQGLFCYYEPGKDTAVIWNPSVRKTVAIPLPNVLCVLPYWTVVGFGICPCGLDPKLVKITYVSDLSKLEDASVSTQVENLPHKSIRFGYSQEVVDGFIYWDVVDWIDVGDGFRNHNVIMSFDLTTEEFAKVSLPDCLALKPRADLPLSNFRDSLAILAYAMGEKFLIFG